MTRKKVWPATILLSHQTENPNFCSSSAMSLAARSSSRAQLMKTSCMIFIPVSAEGRSWGYLNLFRHQHCSAGIARLNTIGPPLARRRMQESHQSVVDAWPRRQGQCGEPAKRGIATKSFSANAPRGRFWRSWSDKTRARQQTIHADTAATGPAAPAPPPSRPVHPNLWSTP